MAQATIDRRHSGILSRATAEEIHVQGVWEDVRPTKLANAILPPFVVVMRLTMGWIFVYAGFDKLINGFSAGGFFGPCRTGPACRLVPELGENQAALDVINPMVVWGEILMFMFYIAELPPEHNPFMEYYLIYILVLGVLGALGAGRILGLDAVIERLPFVRRIPGASYLLG